MKVEDVINDFVGSIEERGVHKTFMDGYCYDFAHMLKRSFPSGCICFVEEESHAVFYYDGCYYDITGRRDDLSHDKTVVVDDE